MVPFELDSIGRIAAAHSEYPWLETVVITSLFFAVGAWTHPTDPLLTQQGFPWTIFAVILIGMRYGAAEAFAASVALHLAAAGLAQYIPASVWPLPLSFSLGMLICALLVGEFRDAWEQKTEKLERSNEYRQARLEEFTNSYHVLKISHDALEQAHAGDRNSLRSALLSAREQLHEASPESIGNTLLELLATYISVRGASYHQVDKNRVNVDPDAALGPAEPLDQTDPMLLKAVASCATVSVRPEDTESLGSRKLGAPMVIIPVVDAYNVLHGIVSITQIPFFSLTEKNLQLASIIAGRFADYLRVTERVAANKARADFNANQEDMYWFTYHVLRCVDQANRWGLKSTILLNQFDDAEQAQHYITTINMQTRGLDFTLAWKTPDGRQNLIMLLPLTDTNGAEYFMRRFDSYIKEEHSVDLLEAQISTHRLPIEAETSPESVASFFVRFMGKNNEISRSFALDEDLDEDQNNDVPLSA